MEVIEARIVGRGVGIRGGYWNGSVNRWRRFGGGGDGRSLMDRPAACATAITHRSTRLPGHNKPAEPNGAGGSGERAMQNKPAGSVGGGQ
jgi:hypothetical protein